MPDRPPRLPLSDEAHIAAWLAYEHDAGESGAFEALTRRFVQLRFPIRAGMSQQEAYRAATRRGAFNEADTFAPGLVLHDPAGLDLTVHASTAGRIPVLTASDRRDFVALVQAFTERNEPVSVPDSVGACMVSGLNNWDRIAAYRAVWEHAHQDDLFDEGWAGEFRRLTARKDMYQDRFIILSRGAYSGVSAADVHLRAAEWLDRSLVIRREHECTHYFVFRASGVVPHRVLDELIADFVGLMQAFGTYPQELARRFLGIENASAYRSGGRLEYYRGTPPLSDDAFKVLAHLCARAIENLAAVGTVCERHLATLDGLARVIFVLSRLSLEEVAGAEAHTRVVADLARL